MTGWGLLVVAWFAMVVWMILDIHMTNSKPRILKNVHDCKAAGCHIDKGSK